MKRYFDLQLVLFIYLFPCTGETAKKLSPGGKGKQARCIQSQCTYGFDGAAFSEEFLLSHRVCYPQISQRACKYRGAPCTPLRSLPFCLSLCTHEFHYKVGPLFVTGF